MIASLSLIAIAVAGCGGDGDPTGLAVTGIVTGVESVSLVELASLSIEDQDGATWRFVADGFVGMTPSHLRAHQETREAVTVSFARGEDGALVVKIITDASE